jgi:UDP-N-acetylmuramoyl-tripeptide--D-alanyl-D-alanine ligase
MRWSLQQVSEALATRLPAHADKNTLITGVSIDSRTLRPDELFIAIAGPSHDGHKFVESALKSGALAAIVSPGRANTYAAEFSSRLIEVPDTFAALQRLSAAVLQAWRAANPNRKVGAVAGSLGKTTTKELLAALVGARHKVLKSAGNLNNEYGLPLTLLRLEDDHEAVIVELGMSRRGELARLTQLAQPDVALITRIAVEHLEFFKTLEEVAAAERELIENLSLGSASTGRAPAISVLNADDDHVVRFAHSAPGPVVWFSCEPGIAAADHRTFRAENIDDHGIDGTSFDLLTNSGKSQQKERLKLSLIGRHNVMNAVAAFAAAAAGWNITAADVRKVFAAFTPADKRGEVIKFPQDFTVIDDSYNSSPTALNAVADTLADADPKTYRRRILASGEMLELGEAAPQLHRDSGAYAAQTRRIDFLIGVRGHALDFINGAIAGGQPDEHTRFFENSDQAAEFLSTFIRPGDLLLVKGSRGVKMEKIVAALRAKFPVAPNNSNTPSASGNHSSSSSSTSSANKNSHNKEPLSTTPQK